MTEPATTPERDLPILALTGFALAVIALTGFVIPASLLDHTAIRDNTPLDRLFPGANGQPRVLAVFVLLLAVFLGGVAIAGRLRGRQAVLVALAITSVLGGVFVFAFPSGSMDIYHNVADTRTLWVYGDNPLKVPPSAHPDQPIIKVIYKWGNQTSKYGPLAYFVYGPAVLIAGEGVVASLIAVKVVNVLVLLLLTLLVGWAAADLAPARRVQAMVLVGWNPFVLYEGVVNAHNDLIMMTLAVAGLMLTVRGTLTGPVLVVVSAGVKFMTGLALPLTLLWLWRNGSPRQRRLIAAAAGIGVLIALVAAVLLSFYVDQQWNFAARSIAYWSPIAVLGRFLRPWFGSDLTVAARYIAWALFVVVALIVVARQNRTPRSLWAGSCWLMLAAAALVPTNFFAWYLLWAIPLGAVLVGNREADLAVALSVTGFLSYGIYEWADFSRRVEESYVAFVFLLPLAYVLLAEWLPLPSLRERQPTAARVAPLPEHEPG